MIFLSSLWVTGDCDRMMGILLHKYYLLYTALPTVHCSYTQLGKQAKWRIEHTAEVASWPFYNSGKASVLGSAKGISEYQ